jgi:four helix bundle protein
LLDWELEINRNGEMTMSENGFRQLKVWQRGKALAVEVYKLTAQGQVTCDFSLVDQLRRSAVSVPSNIAEGDERDSDKDSVRFFNMAKGSLAELTTQLKIAKEVGYLMSSEVDPLCLQCTEFGKMLGALIKARRRFTAKLLFLGVGLSLGLAAALLLAPSA